MNLTLEEMNSVNSVQLDIFKAFIKVCDALNLKYYMVHGSLLGAVRYNGFFPFDDDIDVAMPRRDYNLFVLKGAKLLPEYLFLQSCSTERAFPLQFAKLRDTRTTFIQPEMEKFGINQGIYIDVFPIDYYPESKIVQRWYSFIDKVYNARISKEMVFVEKQPLWKTLLRQVASIVLPSWYKAVERRANLYSNIREGEKVIIVGGKVSERGIPIAWFSDGVKIPFVDIFVVCPSYYKEYLECIYGEYSTYDPAAKYKNKDNTVSVSASVVSVNHSFMEKE